MMELRDALDQIAEIRQQVARTEEFRGYRALPDAFSGLLALAAAGMQFVLVPDPINHILAYLGLWIGIAFLSVFATGWEMACRVRRSSSSLEREKIFVALTQFVPCLIVGAVL